MALRFATGCPLQHQAPKGERPRSPAPSIPWCTHPMAGLTTILPWRKHARILRLQTLRSALVHEWMVVPRCMAIWGACYRCTMGTTGGHPRRLHRWHADLEGHNALCPSKHRRLPERVAPPLMAYLPRRRSPPSQLHLSARGRAHGTPPEEEKEDHCTNAMHPRR